MENSKFYEFMQKGGGTKNLNVHFFKKIEGPFNSPPIFQSVFQTIFKGSIICIFSCIIFLLTVSLGQRSFEAEKFIKLHNQL